MSKLIFQADDEYTFKKQFVVHFLAAYDVKEYTRNCQTGWKQHHIPVEDAKCLADKAWEKLCEIEGVNAAK